MLRRCNTKLFVSDLKCLWIFVDLFPRGPSARYFNSNNLFSLMLSKLVDLVHLWWHCSSSPPVPLSSVWFNKTTKVQIDLKWTNPIFLKMSHKSLTTFMLPQTVRWLRCRKNLLKMLKGYNFIQIKVSKYFWLKFFLDTVLLWFILVFQLMISHF